MELELLRTRLEGIPRKPDNAAESLCRQEHAEFQGHVEAWETAGRVRFNSRDIMDAIVALGDDFEDFVNSNLAGIVDFQGAPRPKVAGEDRKNDCFEESTVMAVKRTIDENIGCIITWRHLPPEVADQRAW